MARFVFLFSSVLLLSSFASAQTVEAEDLQFLIIEAMQKNPRIAADVARMELMERRIPQASALDDPQFTYKLMEFPGTRFSEPVYQNFELMQMIMFPTKLSTKKAIAEIQAEHAHHDHLETILDVTSQVKAAYAMLWAARTRLAINQENQRLLQQILQAAQTQYAVGNVTLQDVLKTNIELAKQKSQEAAIQQEIAAAESMLRALLLRPTDVPIGPIHLDALEPITQTPETFIAYAFANRPMLLHDSLSVVEGDLMVSLMKQEYLPDFRVSLERVTMPTIGMKSWTVMAGISLPFAPWTLSKASARVQEATAERAMRTSMFTSSKSMVEADIRKTYASVKALEVQVQSFERTIIPQTQQSLQALLAEYQTGKTNYLMLIDGFRMYEEMKMEATMARMNYEQERAKLERATGVIDLSIIPSSTKEN
ncbi:MAG TPA: TolC family protein [Bacteroidota bacterium]|nr:TolC family protein [Bacteroidota bacterium]